jgi:hypothetical protein
MTNKSYRQLILVPTQADWQPDDRESWLAQLQQKGFLGKQLDSTFADRFSIGEYFLQFFSFMGCSPAVEFSPPDEDAIDWQRFTFISIPAALSETKWLADRQTARPACPACKKRTREWLEQKAATTRTLQCPACQSITPVCDWNWYDGGGCARQFVSIVNVYPREAIPTDHFLNLLADTTGTTWRYFYIDSALVESQN